MFPSAAQKNPPYKLGQHGDQWCVELAATGDPIDGGCHDGKQEALNHLAALEANVPEAKSLSMAGGLITASINTDPQPGQEIAKYMEGYLVKATDPNRRDLYGEYFSERTDFVRSAYPVIGAPALFEHGRDGSLGPHPIGRFIDVKWGPGDVYAKAIRTFIREYGDFLVGLEAPDKWKAEQENLAREYDGMLDDMFSSGMLKWSSGALPGAVVVSDQGEILRWPIQEGSGTSHAADPYNNTLITARQFGELLNRQPPVFVKSLFIPGVSLMPNQTKPNERQLDENDLLQLRNLIRQEVAAVVGPLLQQEEMQEQEPAAMAAVDDALDQAQNPPDPNQQPQMAADMPQDQQDQLIDQTVQKALEAAFAAQRNDQARRMRRQSSARAVVEAQKRAARGGVNGHSRAYENGEPPAQRGTGRDEHRYGVAPYQTSAVIRTVEDHQKAIPFLSQIKATLPWGHRNFDMAYTEAWKGYMAEQVAEKAQSANIGPLGAWIGAPALREDLVDQLRAKTVLDKLGTAYTYVDGNQTVERPRLIRSPKGQWLGENNSVQDDYFQAEMLLAVPKPLAGLYALPFALLDRMQASDETTLRNQLTKSLQLSIDEAALRGIGAVPSDATPSSTGAQPLGLLNLLPAGQVVDLGDREPTPDDMKDIKAAVEARNIDLTDNAGWVSHPNVKNFFEAMTDTTGQLINPVQWNKGFDWQITTTIPTNLGAGASSRIYFGEWPFLEVVMSSQIQLVLLTGDVYTAKLQVGVMCYVYVDFLVHHTEAFEVREGVAV